MVDTETLLVSLQAEICGFRIDRVLAENQSWLATGPGGRPMVLKVIDPDCLVYGSLHPGVRDRLSRVRELAHPSVANLFGVEREGDQAYLMWEYVPGHALDFYAGANRTPRDVATAARELVLAVDLLHMQGIVHGALIPGNVIVSNDGTVRLTHISPLLFTDPAVDIECVWNLLECAAEQLGERGQALTDVVSRGRAANATLRQLASRLNALIDARDARKTVDRDAEPTSAPRKRALMGAALVAVLGVAFAWGIRHAIETGRLGAPDNARMPLHATNDR